MLPFMKDFLFIFLTLLILPLWLASVIAGEPAKPEPSAAQLSSVFQGMMVEADKFVKTLPAAEQKKVEDCKKDFLTNTDCQQFIFSLAEKRRQSQGQAGQAGLAPVRAPTQTPIQGPNMLIQVEQEPDTIIFIED